MDLQEFGLYFPQTQLPRGVRAQLIGAKLFQVRVWKWCEDAERVCSSATGSDKPCQSAAVVDILYGVTVLKGCAGSESSLFILLLMKVCDGGVPSHPPATPRHPLASSTRPAPPPQFCSQAAASLLLSRCPDLPSHRVSRLRALIIYSPPSLLRLFLLTYLFIFLLLLLLPQVLLLRLIFISLPPPVPLW